MGKGGERGQDITTTATPHLRQKLFYPSGCSCFRICFCRATNICWFIFESDLPKYGHWEVGKLLKWIRKSGNVTGNPVNWMRKSYCAVFRGADGLMIKCF